MKKGIVIVSILLSLVVIGIYVKQYVDKFIERLSFSFDLNRLKLGTLNIYDFINNSAKIQVNVSVFVNNGNQISVPIQIKDFQIFSKGNLIGSQNKDEVSNKKYTVLKNDRTEIRQNINVIINPTNIQFALDLKKGIPQEINYTVSVSIFGITINKKGKETI